MEYIDFATRHWDLFAILAFIIMLLFWNLFRHKIQGYTPVTPEEAVSIINQKDSSILDVREDKEVERDGKITDAKLISLKLIGGVDTSQVGQVDAPLLVVCHNGNRSIAACGKLKKKGFTQLYSLKGGIVAWRKANLPMVRK